MTQKKSRFGTFVLPQDQSESKEQGTTILTPGVSRAPTAPEREERRPFSTRLKPSLKRVLDGYVMELKLAGWSVSQEGVLEELVKSLGEDAELKASITQRLVTSAK